jgi:hypothetical protein
LYDHQHATGIPVAFPGTAGIKTMASIPASITRATQDQNDELVRLKRQLRYARWLITGILGLMLVLGAWGSRLESIAAAQQQQEQPGQDPSAKPDLSDPARQAEVQVDASQVSADYANFCRVTATPEEVLLDFGVNQAPFTKQEQKVVASHRLVLSYYTAKRLAIALEMSLQRHEKIFGPIELDVRRRAIGAGKTAAPGKPGA